MPDCGTERCPPYRSNRLFRAGRVILRPVNHNVFKPIQLGEAAVESRHPNAWEYPAIQPETALGRFRPEPRRTVSKREYAENPYGVGQKRMQLASEVQQPEEEKAAYIVNKLPDRPLLLTWKGETAPRGIPETHRYFRWTNQFAFVQPCRRGTQWAETLSG